MRAHLHRANGRALTIVAVVLTIAGVFALGVWAGRRSVGSSRKSEAFARIEDARVRAIEASSLPPLAGKEEASGADRLKGFKNALGEAAKKMDASERKPLLAAQDLIARIQPQMAEYEASLTALRKAGFVAPATLKTQDEIRARGGLVQRFNEANGALIRYFKNVERDYRAALDQMGVAGDVKESVLAGFRRGGNFDLNLKIHESNRQLAASMQEMLKLLSREWGAWRTNEKGEIIFDREDAVKEFETFQGELTAAAARHEDAERKLMERAAVSGKR